MTGPLPGPVPSLHTRPRRTPLVSPLDDFLDPDVRVALGPVAAFGAGGELHAPALGMGLADGVHLRAEPHLLDGLVTHVAEHDVVRIPPGAALGVAAEGDHDALPRVLADEVLLQGHGAGEVDIRVLDHVVRDPGHGPLIGLGVLPDGGPDRAGPDLGQAHARRLAPPLELGQTLEVFLELGRGAHRLVYLADAVKGNRQITDAVVDDALHDVFVDVEGVGQKRDVLDPLGGIGDHLPDVRVGQGLAAPGQAHGVDVVLGALVHDLPEQVELHLADVLEHVPVAHGAVHVAGVGRLNVHVQGERGDDAVLRGQVPVEAVQHVAEEVSLVEGEEPVPLGRVERVLVEVDFERADRLALPCRGQLVEQGLLEQPVMLRPVLGHHGLPGGQGQGEAGHRAVPAGDLRPGRGVEERQEALPLLMPLNGFGHGKVENEAQDRIGAREDFSLEHVSPLSCLCPGGVRRHPDRFSR